MNFEHLFNLIKNKKNQLKNRKILKKFINYHVELLKIKKNKLKLGAVTFDIIQKNLYNIITYQVIEMRYIRQDTSFDDELKLENQLKALNWKWDYANVLAFLIIFALLILIVISYIYLWYCNNLFTFAFKHPKYDLLIKNSFQLLFFNHSIFLNKYVLINMFLTDSLINLCLFFKVFF